VRGYAVKNNNIIFVTCIYDGYNGTIFGGRKSRKTYYMESLKSICNIGHTIYCFTSENLYDELSSHFSQFNNLILIKKELTEFWFSNSILEIKNEKPDLFVSPIFWKDRNCHIMWGKTEMLKIIMKKENPNYIFWIDAGLSSDQLFPHEYFPNPKNRNYSVGIFNNYFIMEIIKHIKNRIISIHHTVPNNRPLPEKYYNITSNRRTHAMLGGFFGGRVEHMDIFCCVCTSKILDIINNKELFSEESIYSTIVHENENIFRIQMFDSFYHKDWGNRYNENRKPFSDCFKQFIKNEQT